MIGLTNDGIAPSGDFVNHDGNILDDGKRRRRSIRSVKKSRRSAKKSRRSAKKSRRSAKKSRRSAKKSRRSAKKSRRSRRSKKSRRSAKKSRRSTKKSRRSAKKSRRSRRSKKSRRSRRSKKHDGISAGELKSDAIRFAKNNGIDMKHIGALMLLVGLVGGSVVVLRKYNAEYKKNLEEKNLEEKEDKKEKKEKEDWSFSGFFNFVYNKLPNRQNFIKDVRSTSKL